MKSDQIRSDRLNDLRKMAFRLSSQGKTPEQIVLALKDSITKMGVSKTTAQNYFDTVVRQIGK